MAVRGAYWLLSAVLLVALGYATKFYRGRYLVGSFDEAFGLALHIALVGAVTLVASPVMTHPAPRSVVVLTPPLALLISAAGRFTYRALRDRTSGDVRAEARRVLVYGAGDAGRQVLQLFRTETDVVVGFLDDNPGKRHLRIQGVPVVGSGGTIADAAQAVDADVVVLAIPTPPAELIGPAQERAKKAGLDFLVLPRVSELIGGKVRATDLRPVEIGDVLGRHQVSTSLTDIAGYLTGKRVLITGAGGSIGSELSRQVRKFGPATLVMLDRDESALHAVQLSIFGHGLLDRPDTVLADIRDRAALAEVFAEHRPRSSSTRRRSSTCRCSSGSRRGLEDQRPRHPQPARASATLRGRALRQHLDRQGGRVDERAGLHQAARRAADGLAGQQHGPATTSVSASATSSAPAARCCTPSQPDRAGRPDHGHPPRRHPLLHDHPRGV